MRPTRQPQHPLHGVAGALPGDTSVDTSRNVVQDEADLTEPREVAAVFGAIGQDNQGAVGVAVADTDAAPGPRSFEEMPDVADAEFGYAADPEAPEDAAGPEPRMGPLGPFSVEELTRDPAAGAAAAAATAVTRTDTVDMLDAMQSAEAAYAAAAGEAPGPAPPPRPHHPVASQDLRARVCEKLGEALAANPGFAGDAAAAGAAAEAAIFAAAHSAAVYQSVAANAVRVAAHAADLNEVLRVAQGQPRGV